MSKIFFTSDTHFHHRRILTFCPRPFPDVEAMNEGLIERWNARVGPEDTVYHLGDFSFGNLREHAEVCGRLNGTIHLIWGNHDRRDHIIKVGRFATTQDVAEIVVDGEKVFLSHYAHRVWNRSHHGSYHLFGHTHNMIKPVGRSIDVGVDTWGCAPVTFDEIKVRLTELGTINDFGVSVDHGR